MKVIYIYVLLIAMLFVSCQYNERMGYINDRSGVHFYIDSYSAITQIDKSFAATLDKEIIVDIPVRRNGFAEDKDLYFKMIIVDSTTTAISGVDFEPLADSYLFPAGEYTTTAQVKIFNSENIKDKSVLIDISLIESEDFDIGEIDRTRCQIAFSNILIKPSNWDSNTYYYKDYSETKYRIFLQLTGLDIFPTQEEISADSYYYRYVVPRELSAYLSDNYPVHDENGNIIESW